MDIVDRLSMVIGEDGEGVASPGTVTSDITKISQGTKKSYPKKKKKKKITDLLEKIILDIEVGDIVLGGKFKNKKIKVNKIGMNDKGEPTINDKPFLKIRPPIKQEPEEEREEKDEEKPTFEFKY